MINRHLKFSFGQFVVLLIFTFTIWMIIMDPTPISALACILLIVLSGVYVFILGIELIGQFSKGGPHIFPVIYVVLYASLVSVKLENYAKQLHLEHLLSWKLCCFFEKYSGHLSVYSRSTSRKIIFDNYSIV